MPAKKDEKPQVPEGQPTVDRDPDPTALVASAPYDPAAKAWRPSDLGGDDETLSGVTGSQVAPGSASSGGTTGTRGGGTASA